MKSRKKIYRQLFIMIICLVLSSFSAALMLYISMDYKNVDNYKITENSNVSYEVFLKPNNFFQEKSLKENMQYVATLIDYFNIKFNYKIDFNKKTNFMYTYSIDAITNVYDDKNNTKLLYTRKDRILNDVAKALKDADTLKIDVEQNINYAKYNNIVNELRKEYALDVNSSVTIVLNVTINGNSENVIGDISNNSETSVTIPLTEKTINVSASKKLVNNKKEYPVKKEGIKNPKLFGVGSFLAVVSLYSLYKVLALSFVLQKSKTKYDKELAKILKEYDRAIVSAKEKIVLEPDINILDVASFTELLDVHDNLHLPIIFIEVYKGQLAWFIIRKHNQVYRFKLKSEDVGD